MIWWLQMAGGLTGVGYMLLVKGRRRRDLSLIVASQVCFGVSIGLFLAFLIVRWVIL